MEFVSDLNEKEYNDFLMKSADSVHFLQSVEWANVKRMNKKIETHLVGVKEDNKLIAVASLIGRRLPLGYSYWTIPRGFLMDYNNRELLSFFTKSVVDYTKKFKSIYLKIDPDIELHKIDHQNNVLDGPNNYDLVKDMEKLGYKHLGYNKFFEHSYPRYTFRIDLTSDVPTIVERFHQSAKQRIKKAEVFGVKVKIGDYNDVNKFYELMEKTEKKKDFYSHNLKFYQEFYKIFHKNNHVTLYIATINIDESLKNINNEIDKLTKELENSDKLTKNQKQTLNNQIEGFKKSSKEFMEVQKEMGNEILLSAYMIVNYGVKCWTLYSCNEPKVKGAFGNYLIYNTQVIDAHNKGFKIFDAFGTIGDLNADNHLIGLHEFKKKFGGEYIEFIGEFDYVQRKLMYFLWTKLVPYYHKLVNKSLKKSVKKNVQ